jgi:rod shape determining protein RodA
MSLPFDWILLAPSIALALLGILTMHTFGIGNSFAPRQLLFLVVAVSAYCVIAALDMRFIRRTSFALAAYGISLTLLLMLLFVSPVQGAQSWFSLGPISFQPADFAKLALIAVLAKYLSRRHVEIGNIRHILVSGLYTAALTVLILIEPDLGTALIIMSIWLALMLISGISKKHLALLALLALAAGVLLWFGGLQEYQRDRIVAFLNPAGDIHGSGYNAYQARVAFGSGELFGKGIGYGTQSKLRFLPEYQTDFIFAAYAEEWGFVGIVLVLALYGVLFWRLMEIARTSATNMDAFFTLGVLVLLASHVGIHAGINVGLLPVTGTTIPFMSAGGSHLLAEFMALGVVTSLTKYGRSAAREAPGRNEYLGG